MILAPLVVGRKGEQARPVRRTARAGLRARARRRQGARNRRAAQARRRTSSTRSRWWSTASRCAPDIKQRLAESFETALRHADGRALAVEMDSGTRTPVLGELRLPGLQLFAAGTRAAPVFVQQSDGRLPALRRPRPDQFLRSETRGGLPAPVARRRRHQGLGPAQPVLLPDAATAWRSTTASISTRRSSDCRRRCSEHRAATAPAREKIRFNYLGERGNKYAARARIRRHHARTWSAATAKPIR